MGIADLVLAYYREHRSELDEKGIRADYWVEALERLKAEVGGENARQELLKAELRTTTANLKRLDRKLYALSAGAIDAAVGAHGKGTPAGNEVARIRSRIRRRQLRETVPREVTTGGDPP